MLVFIFLELLMFMLDREIDANLRRHLQETLTCLLKVVGTIHPSSWLQLLQDVLMHTEGRMIVRFEYDQESKS
jgi:hypothetical protein